MENLKFAIEPIENGFIVTRPSPSGQGSGKVWYENPVSSIRALRVALDVAEKELTSPGIPLNPTKK